MNLRKFEHALTVAEEGSITAAAERLGIAQPSLSQQISSLEKQVGVRLFTRTPQGMVPTAAGRAFLTEAEVATTASRRALTAARAADGDLTGELIIAVYLGLGTRQLPRALGELRRRHPHLRVTIHEEPDPTDMERLARQGTLDMLLVHEIPPGCIFDVHKLGEESYVAVLPKGHRLLRQDEPLPLESLADQGWVRFRRGSKLDEYLARLLADRSLAPKIVGRASQISTAVRFAAEGLGVTVAPSSAIPEGFEQLTRRLRPALLEPVIAGVRRSPGRAETALLDQLKRQDWPEFSVST